MIQRNLQDACKSLHLSYIIDHYDEISFETCFSNLIVSHHYH